MSRYVDRLMDDVTAKNPGEPEFYQAVREVAGSVELVIERHPHYGHERILERIIEPERVVMFRVPGPSPEDLRESRPKGDAAGWLGRQPQETSGRACGAWRSFPSRPPGSRGR